MADQSEFHGSEVDKEGGTNSEIRRVKRLNSLFENERLNLLQKA